ncbi:WxL domain-containing protein [Enterococcus hirae]
MQKSISLLGATLLVSTIFLGSGSAFAETSITPAEPTPATAQTPITADLTVDTAQKPTLPEGTTDTDHNNTQTTNPLGIAYTPKTLSGSAKLNASGQQEIDLANNSSSGYHVGVKDLTRQKHEWTLTAKLAWTGDTQNYMDGATVKLTGDGVTINNQGVLSPELTGTVNGQPSVTITTTSSSEVMKSEKTLTQNGVYDYKFINPKLVIPEVSKVPAGTYSGNINWDLALTPEM